jgi:uroporphyrinogen-III synthase
MGNGSTLHSAVAHMAEALNGQTIALAEGRQIEELAQMLEKEGATVLRYPMLSIVDAADDKPVVAWLRDLVANQFAYVVLLTGEGLRRLLGFADRAGLRNDVVSALARAQTITRGPKPGRALREIGLAPSFVAAAPTTEGVIETLQVLPLRGQTVGVQMYSAENAPLAQFLGSAGAKMAPVLPYAYAPATDAEHVAQLINRMALGEIAALVFTSSPQVDRLYQVADERKLEDELARGLRQTRVAAVGPIVADNLRHRGVTVHICPEQGFVMKNLVKHISEALK